MKGVEHTAWQAFEVFVRTSDGRRLNEHAAAPTINEFGQIDPHSQVCWLECPADLDEPFEVVIAFHDRRHWHTRADLFADGEYIDGRRFGPDSLQPWTFDRLSQHEDDGIYRSKLTFGKIELTEDEHDAMPLQKLQELGELRVTFKPGEVIMRHAGPRRGGGRGRHNDGYSGPKKIYERHKKAKLDRTVQGMDRRWEQRQQSGDQDGRMVPRFVPFDRRGLGYTFRFKYSSREMLLANGVIEVKEEPNANRLLIEEESYEEAETPATLSDDKPCLAKLSPRSREDSVEGLEKPDISVLGGTARNFIGSARHPIDMTAL